MFLIDTEQLKFDNASYKIFRHFEAAQMNQTGTVNELKQVRKQFSIQFIKDTLCIQN